MLKKLIFPTFKRQKETTSEASATPTSKQRKLRVLRREGAYYPQHATLFGWASFVRTSTGDGEEEVGYTTLQGALDHLTAFARRFAPEEVVWEGRL
jgi:hypothetical protein